MSPSQLVSLETIGDVALQRTTYFDGRLELQQDGLSQDDFPGGSAEVLDLGFGEIHQLSGAIAAHCK